MNLPDTLRPCKSTPKARGLRTAGGTPGRRESTADLGSRSAFCELGAAVELGGACVGLEVSPAFALASSAACAISPGPGPRETSGRPGVSQPPPEGPHPKGGERRRLGVSRAPLRVLCARVDWWETAYRVTVSADARTELGKVAKLAEKHGRAPIELGALRGEAKAGKRPGTFSVTNGEASILVSTDEPSGWTVSVTWRSMTLARSTIADLIERGRAIALSLGTPDRESPDWEHMRRIDLAADVEGWEIGPDDATAFVGRALRATGRGRVRRFRGVVGERFEDEDEREIESQTWHSGDRVTTVAICYGAPLMDRTYDKLAELELPGRELKREEEHARWKARGWDGLKPIARNEVQWRGEALGEMRAPGGDGVEGHSYKAENGRWHDCFCSDCRDRRKDATRTARNPEIAAKMLNELWAYATTSWARMIVHGSASRRTRCATDPRWALLQGLTFTHDAIAGRRVRHRVGPTVANVIGTVRAFVASRGLMPRIIAHDLAYADASEAREASVSLVHATFGLAFDAIAGELRQACQDERGAFDALDDLIIRHNAAVLRYHVDERRPGGGVRALPAPVVPAWLRERYDAADERAAIQAAE